MSCRWCRCCRWRRRWNGLSWWHRWSCRCRSWRSCRRCGLCRWCRWCRRWNRLSWQCLRCRRRGTTIASTAAIPSATTSTTLSGICSFSYVPRFRGGRKSKIDHSKKKNQTQNTCYTWHLRMAFIPGMSSFGYATHT